MLPQISGPLPGPNARRIIERDSQVLSPSYMRAYPWVVDRGEGAIVIDMPRRLIHMSGTDFYYSNMVDLAEKLASIAPGSMARRVSVSPGSADGNFHRGPNKPSGAYHQFGSSGGDSGWDAKIDAVLICRSRPAELIYRFN